MMRARCRVHERVEVNVSSGKWHNVIRDLLKPDALLITHAA
jgi:hypothetical protein